MKNLIYKEIKLSIHPICYVFVTVFPFLFSFTPGFGAPIAFVYCLAAFPVLLLGANKGRSTNDIYYSVLLPIRKADIVKGKMFSIIYLELLSMISVFLGMVVTSFFPKNPDQKINSPFTFKTYGILLAIAIVGYAFVNLIMFVLYFKKAKSITLPTILILVFLPLYMLGFAFFLPTYIMSKQMNFWNTLISPLGQIITLLIAIIIFAIITILTYIISSKRFSKSDQ